MKRNVLYAVVIVLAVLVIGCGAAVSGAVLPAASSQEWTVAPVQQASYAANAAAPAAAEPLPSNALVAALEGTLADVYASVSPSVVTLEVISQASGQILSPFGQQAPQAQQGLGSGFVWDSEGHIVTNNHVVENATSVTVVFGDGYRVPGKVVGSDAQSDLAVVKVDVAKSRLKPVVLGDSARVKVGQLVIAIGSPFGEEQTMTTGIVSALGRSLPVETGAQSGAYTIPAVIQTDAAINPGNSGGVLLDAQGRVIGVTAAIESAVRSSAGVGFAIPSAVVRKVVPSLISSGAYKHAYLGVSGADLTSELAKAMNLKDDQRGALIGDVVANGPAAAAGLRGADSTATVNGSQRSLGGDVIVAIDGQAVTRFSDVVAYLELSTTVGQKVKLTILRDGKEEAVTVTLGARPVAGTESASGATPRQSTPNQGQATGSAALGIQSMDMSSDLATAMGLPAGQTGVLIVSVLPDGAAAEADLRGGSKQATIGGQTVQIGGDVIIALGGKTVSNLEGLRSLLSTARVGQRVIVTILRDGERMNVRVTLGQSSAPQG